MFTQHDLKAGKPENQVTNPPVGMNGLEVSVKSPEQAAAVALNVHLSL